MAGQVKVKGIIDLSDELGSVTEFAKSLTDCSLVLLSDDEFASWDSGAGNDFPARSQFWREAIEMTIERQRSGLILHNTEGIVVGLAKERCEGEWEIMNVDGVFRHSKDLYCGESKASATDKDGE